MKKKKFRALIRKTADTFTRTAITHPTYDEIMAIPNRTPVTVTLRSASGERAVLYGELFAPEPGKRQVGTVNIAYRRSQRGFGRDESVTTGVVPSGVIEILA